MKVNNGQVLFWYTKKTMQKNNVYSLYRHQLFRRSFLHCCTRNIFQMEKLASAYIVDNIKLLIEDIKYYFRLSSLKQSGQDEWKKRISRDLKSPEIVLRQKLTSPIRPKSIADLKGALSSSQGGWKNRVEESDAKSFTVSEKITKKG